MVNVFFCFSGLGYQLTNQISYQLAQINYTLKYNNNNVAK